MPAKILLVSDSTKDLFIVKNILNEYEILTAEDNKEAVDLIYQNDDIDLIILDINKPNMAGFKLLEGFKKSKINIPTIILTDYGEPEYEINGFKLGAIDYIRKPIHKESFKVRIDVHIEINSNRLSEEKVNNQNITYETIFNKAPTGIAISFSIDPVKGNSDFIEINPMYEKITGRTKEELLNLGWAKITHPEDLKKELEAYKRLQSGEIDRYSFEKRYIRPDGSIVWVDLVVARLNSVNDQRFNNICMVQDITSRKAIEAELRESERSKSVILSHLPGLAFRCKYDQEWTMLYVSQGCFELTGYAAESLICNRGISFYNIIAPEYRDSLSEKWRIAIETRSPIEQEYEIITASGERKWVLEIAQGIFNEEDCLNSIEGILLDITDRKEMENHLRYISEHDNWTGLHNRNYFVNLLKKDLKDGFQGKRAIVGLNLSGLPSLATIYGFQYTQDLKVSLTEGLKSFCSDNIELFNTYDNRFLFYLKDYKNKYEIDLFCDELIHKLSELLERRVTGGIGAIELNKYLDMNVDQILRNLLIASERAIEQYDREFKVCYYDKRMGLEIIREEIIKNELSRVVTDPNDGGLFLEYQPILDLRTNKIAGFEALARLNSDKLGRLAPLEFIPISEKTKLIDPVGKKIMKKALCFLKELEKRGYSEIFVSINISPIQMLRSDFIKSVVDMINNLKINPKNVAFEITETMFASNYLEINSILGKLMDFGITISIDDFGTGYSSFARERELNVNCVKIDKQFIDRLMVLDPEDAITGDIISMAHKLRHKVIAEGVEYEEQRQYLKENGCDKIQGYLIAKPISDLAAIKFLMNSSL